MPPPERPAANPAANRPPSGKPGSAERGTATGGAPPATPAPEKRLAVKVLALTDKATAGFRLLAQNYLTEELGLPSDTAKASIVQFSSWSELPPLLRRYATIGTLVLVAHGSPGALRIDNRIRGLDLVANDLIPPMPVVTDIDFEACNVGGSPGELVSFGKALGAARVSAFNHYLVTAPISITVSRDTDVKVVAERLKPYEPWLLKNHPTVEQIARMKGAVSLQAEWFRSADEDISLPAGLTVSTARDLMRTFKPRSTAQERHLSAAQALSRSEQDQPPVVPLERIIIDLK